MPGKENVVSSSHALDSARYVLYRIRISSHANTALELSSVLLRMEFCRGKSTSASTHYSTVDIHTHLKRTTPSEPFLNIMEHPSRFVRLLWASNMQLGARAPSLAS
jgi:hypothetical protein